MELITVKTKSHKVVIAPIGDIQWSGGDGPTALDHVKRHIERAMKLKAWFVGMGDYIDFMSPSNRMRLTSAALYDTAQQVVSDAGFRLCQEVYQDILKPTKGRWLGLLEGHHFYEVQGQTSDMWLAKALGCSFLGTSAYIRLEPSGVVLWVHHGNGGGSTPGASLNTLSRVAAGLGGADVYMMGHTTRLSVSRLSRPSPNARHTNLTHADIFLVNCGGFSKSNIVGHKHGEIARGDYAEQRMLTPSPLCAPFIHIDGKADSAYRIRVEV